jgi:PHD/YefM family antitoxin component YafN of YafNO toxin-antitoxin module
MKVVKYSAVRKRLRELLDECESTNEPLMIDSVNNQMIVISKAKFDSMNKQIESDK